MNIIIKTKNLSLTDALQSFIEKKFSGIDKFVSKGHDAVPELVVEIEKETKHHRKGDVFSAEVLLRFPGKKLVAKAKSDDMLKAIVEAKKEMRLEIEKYKLKSIDKNRRTQRKSKGKIEK